jgi:hypothetical protein
VGLVGDPIVDVNAGWLGRAVEIDPLQGCPVVARQPVDERLAEREAILPEQAIGDAQLIALAGHVQVVHQCAKSAVGGVRQTVQVQHAGHFGGGIAAGAGVGHGEGRGDAQRRNHEVRGAFAVGRELGVKIERELVVRRRDAAHRIGQRRADMGSDGATRARTGRRSPYVTERDLARRGLESVIQDHARQVLGAGSAGRCRHEARHGHEAREGGGGRDVPEEHRLPP